MGCVAKGPHPPFGHLLPREGARAKAKTSRLHFVIIAVSRLRLRKWETVPDRADEGSWLHVTMMGE
jgi:hypothetical protein